MKKEKLLKKLFWKIHFNNVILKNSIISPPFFIEKIAIYLRYRNLNNLFKLIIRSLPFIVWSLPMQYRSQPNGGFYDIDIKQYDGPIKDALYGENGYEKYTFFWIEYQKITNDFNDSKNQ